MTWLELTRKHEKEMQEFPLCWAFSKEQLEKAMKKLNVKNEDELTTFGCGSIYRRTDADKLHNMFDNQRRERQEFLSKRENLIDALSYEMGNHEYCITFNKAEVLKACELKEVDSDIWDNAYIEYTGNIRKWYMKNYPDDELGEDIDSDVTFNDIWDNTPRVYELLGDGADSVIRERVFTKIAELKNVEYNVVYKRMFKHDM